MTAEVLASPAPGRPAPDLLAPPTHPPTQSPTRVTPITVAQRYVGVAVVAVVVGALHISHRPATLCPFRALTGIPCPFCGGTTAAVHLGHGDVRSALAASPLAVGLLVSWPLLGVVRPPRWWHSPRVRVLVIAAVLIGSEVWQLARFGII